MAGKMFDVVALGELLVDFTPGGKSSSGMDLFERNPGGAPANVLCALSNLGRRTAFIGKVGKDMHGDFLCETLSEKKVDIRGLIRDEGVFTTLAFVELSAAGERSFSFARKPGADTCLRADELDYELLKSCKIFHFGSLSLTDEPSRSATIEAIRVAKAVGAIISYDPNYRAPLWNSRETAVTQMTSVLDQVDIIKISDEETELITGKTNLKDAAGALLQKGIQCVVITLGKQGAFVAAGDVMEQVFAPDVKAVDTTGAGDAFWGGFLFKLLQTGAGSLFSESGRLKECVAFANTVASFCVQKRGAIPSLPYLNEVMQIYKA